MLLSALLLAGALAADSTRWIVSNHGREAGDLVAVTRGDSTVARWIFTDRNRGTRLETRVHRDASGAIVRAAARPVLADGSTGIAVETFDVVGDSLRYGRMSVPRVNAFVGLRGGTPIDQAALAAWLTHQPNHRGKVAGSSEARAEIIGDSTYKVGGVKLKARLVLVFMGQSVVPNGVWLDDKDNLIATDAQWFITVRPDAVPFLPAFRAVELGWRNADAEALAQKVVTKTSGTVAITNGTLFDAERGLMLPGQTVIVQGDRITAVGPAASTPAPAGATVIDAAGKTIMPGMWEMHTHLQASNQGALGLMQLSQGLTTARDLAADLDIAVSQRDREKAGKLATPRIILAGFIEGPLKWAGPSEALAATEAEARAWVAKYDSLGYKQIKLYNVTHPDLVPVIAAEAHKRGMRLSGHIPRGMSMQAAIALGYDEVQHAAFFFSNFFQDSMYVPTMRAYSAIATAVAPTFDVNSKGMDELIDFVARHNTVIDGTFNLWIGGGAAAVGAGGSRDQARADSAYMNIIRRLWAAGVPLVAGTDNSAGTTYRRELEMYELAGIPRHKILQIATINAARVMKDDRDYGSIRVGKVADILVVNGDPTRSISELQKLETVLRGGRVYKMTDLQTYSGLRARGASAAEGHSFEFDEH